MKKIILSALVVAGSLSFSFAQSQGGGNGNLKIIAKKALTEAGCFTTNGNYDYQITDLGGGCFEVFVVPDPNNHIAPYVKLAPIGKVTICDGKVSSATCY